MRIAPFAVLAVAACSVPSRPPAPLGQNAPERLFHSCPGSAEVLAKAANLSWQPVKSMIEEHRSLRNRLQLNFAESKARILFYSSGAHHTSVQFSVVAARRGDGVWHVDEAGEEGPGLLQIPTRPLPHKAYDLSRDESRRLDSMLDDPCLYAAPTFMRDPNIVAGGAVQTLEIATARHHAVLSWFMIRTPQEARIVTAIARD